VKAFKIPETEEKKENISRNEKEKTQPNRAFFSRAIISWQLHLS
jgi:hypothetical protein